MSRPTYDFGTLKDLVSAQFYDQVADRNSSYP
jgi:hypothetical protein